MPPNLNCVNLTNSEWTTTTFDDQKCIEYENDAGSMCLECNQCETSSLYSSDSPYYLYSVKMHDDIKDNNIHNILYSVCYQMGTVYISARIYIITASIIFIVCAYVLYTETIK